MPKEPIATEAEIYLDEHTYAHLIHALLNAQTSPCPEDAIKIALGEIADIWPPSIA